MNLVHISRSVSVFLSIYFSVTNIFLLRVHNPLTPYYFMFLFNTLTNNRLTVSISSALLAATNKVRLARASLLIMGCSLPPNKAAWLPFLQWMDKLLVHQILV